jgi:pyridoxamine 5'-phosphate oxidase|tara:strand:+ start:3770 stop:4420 length:651 start_codon:yes stop_codon:yes gene_type:complete
MSNAKKNIKNIRIDYDKSLINFNNIIDSPFDFLNDWINDALAIDQDNANACVLSTVSKSLIPSSRVVLLRGISEKGLVFYTNYNSDKSKDIFENDNVCINFFWPFLEKQVRVQGKISKISSIESDNYFNSRPKSSQLGALASDQSSNIPLDFSFDRKINLLKDKYKESSVDRPKYWGGYIIIPSTFEFWQGRPSRLHDRLCYKLEQNNWVVERKSP